MPTIKLVSNLSALSARFTLRMDSYRAFCPMVPRRMTWLPCSLSLIAL